MKKILIFYAAYGGGHLSAAKSIKQYIDEHYTDCETQLVDCIKFINKALDKVTTGAYREMAKKAPWAWGKVYSQAQKGPLSKISTTSNKVMAMKLGKLFKDNEPDLVISTHPFATQMCSYLKKKGKIHSKLATVMTDFAPHDQWLVGHEYNDYFFVSHTGMKEALKDKGIDSSKVFATGIPLSNRFLLNYNKEEILNSFGLSKDKKVVLFFGGGEFRIRKNKNLRNFNISFTKRISYSNSSNCR